MDGWMMDGVMTDYPSIVVIIIIIIIEIIIIINNSACTLIALSIDIRFDYSIIIYIHTTV
jgi:hypothetical protein